MSDDISVTPINMQAAAKTGAKSPNMLGIGQPGDPAFTVNASDRHAVAITEVASTLRSGGSGDASHTARGGDKDENLVVVVGVYTCGQCEHEYPAMGSIDPANPRVQLDGHMLLDSRCPKCGGSADSVSYPEPLPFDTTQVTSPGNYSSPKHGDPCHPLSESAHVPAVAFTQNTRDEVRYIGGNSAGTLPAQPGMKQQTYVAFRTSGNCNATEQGDKTAALNTATDPNQNILTEAVQVQWASGGGQVENPTAQALRSGAEHNYQFARTNTGVRRLTPTETERLQAFPDGWTEFGIVDGKPIPQSDSARYRQMGNAVTVSVARWIAERIKRHLAP